MKRILWVALVIVVFSAALCGLSATAPAIAAQPDLTDSTPADQLTSMQPISEIPPWAWLIMLPAFAVFVLLCAASLVGVSSIEV